MSEGDGENVLDRRGESYQYQSVFTANLIAFMTIFLGLMGVYGGVEAYRGGSYRKSWWFSFLGLWSRGMIFIGPLLILVGMGMVTSLRNSFPGATIRIRRVPCTCSQLKAEMEVGRALLRR